MEELDWQVVQDGFASVLWLSANLLLILASSQVSNQFFPGDLGAAKVLNVATIGCAILTAVLQLLGIIGMFNGACMLVGIAGVSLAILFRMRKQVEESWRDSAPPTATMFWLLLTGLLCGHCFVNGLLKLPTDFDCLMYHLPMVDSWLQAGSLYAPDCNHWSNPGGSELLAAWCCGPFSGDFLAPLNNLPVVAVWASATLQFCRLLGMTQRWPELTTLSALSVYTLFHETDDASNDLMVAAFFMASNVYALRFLNTRSTPLITMVGICSGLLIGVKFFALGYAATTWFTMVCVLFLSVEWQEAACGGVWTAILSLMFGGYWYIRNIVLTGLPLYPMGDSASLAYPNLWETSLVGNAHPNLWPLFFEAIWNVCGPIHWLSTIALPVTIFVVIWKIWLVQGESDFERIFPLGVSIIFLLGSAAVLWVTPYLVEDQPGSLNHLRWAYTPARYGLSYLTMCVVCFYAVISDATRKLSSVGRQVIFAMLGLAAAWQLLLRLRSHTDEFSHIEAAIIGCDIAFVLLTLLRVMPALKIQKMKILVGITIAGSMAVGIAVLSSNWHREFDAHFDHLFKTTAFTKLKGIEFDKARIMVLDFRPYGFFGSRRQHKVINPRRFVSNHWLIRTLQSTNTGLVTTTSFQGYAVDRYRGAFEYLAGNKATFRPIDEFTQIVVTTAITVTPK